MSTVITIIVLFLILVIWLVIKAFKDCKNFVTEDYIFYTDKIEDDFHFVFLSDLHEMQYGKCNELLLNAILDISPDCVLIGGDFLTGYKDITDEFYDTLKFIENLSDKFKVYFVPGNHERALWDVRDFARVTKNSEKKDSDIKRIDMLENILSSKDIPLIRNSQLRIDGTNIVLHGIDLDLKYYRRLLRRVPETSYLKTLIGECNIEDYNIMLAHDPEHFKEYSECGCDLVLSGHVHGGIVRVPGIGGVISPQLRIFPKYDSGVFKRNNVNLLISRGIGTHSIPVRLFNKAEICNVTIKATDRS